MEHSAEPGLGLLGGLGGKSGAAARRWSDRRWVLRVHGVCCHGDGAGAVLIPLCLSLCSDTDSLSQGSSVGSLCMEDDEDRNSLKSHFDNLASSLCEGTRYLLVNLHKFN